MKIRNPFGPKSEAKPPLEDVKPVIPPPAPERPAGSDAVGTKGIGAEGYEPGSGAPAAGAAESKGVAHEAAHVVQQREGYPEAPLPGDQLGDVTPGDIDGDGAPEVAASVHLNGLPPGEPVIGAVAAGDLDGDGALEAAVEGAVRTAREHGSGMATGRVATGDTEGEAVPGSTAVAGLNGLPPGDPLRTVPPPDLEPDLVTASNADGTQGTSTSMVTDLDDDGPSTLLDLSVDVDADSAVALADLDVDGLTDLADIDIEVDTDVGDAIEFEDLMVD